MKYDKKYVDMEYKGFKDWYDGLDKEKQEEFDARMSRFFEEEKEKRRTHGSKKRNSR